MLMDEEFPAEDVATLDSLQNLINKNIDEESMDTEKTIFTVDDLMKVRLQHEVQNERTDDEAVTLNGIDKQDPQTSNPDVIWRETDGECYLIFFYFIYLQLYIHIFVI